MQEFVPRPLTGGEENYSHNNSTHTNLSILGTEEDETGACSYSVYSPALSHTQGHPKRGSLTPPTGKGHFSGNVARIAKENI